MTIQQRRNNGINKQINKIKLNNKENKKQEGFHNYFEILLKLLVHTFTQKLEPNKQTSAFDNIGMTFNELQLATSEQALQFQVMRSSLILDLLQHHPVLLRLTASTTISDNSSLMMSITSTIP